MRINILLLTLILASCSSDKDKLLEEDNSNYRNLYIGQSYKEANQSYDLAYKYLMKVEYLNIDTILIKNNIQGKYSFHTYSKNDDWFRSVYFEIYGDTVFSIQQIDKEGCVFVQSLSLIPDRIYIPKTDY
ncbi:MAG: hypothetical protein ACRCX1_10360 [Bacteroidales bacterium]